MAKTVEVLEVFDETGDVLVLFEDDDIGASMEVMVSITDVECKTEQDVEQFLMARFPAKELNSKSLFTGDTNKVWKNLKGKKKRVAGNLGVE